MSRHDNSLSDEYAKSLFINFKANQRYFARSQHCVNSYSGHECFQQVMKLDGKMQQMIIQVSLLILSGAG